MTSDRAASDPKFTVAEYKLGKDGDKVTLFIKGRRVGKPNKRFTLRGTGLKVKGGKITMSQKSKVFEHSLKRVNYLPTMKQTRLHTESMLYPGNYEMELVINGKAADIEAQLSDIGNLFI